MVDLDLALLVPSFALLAYIDPGTGGMMLQVIIGSALACLVAIKLYWRQLTGLIGRLIDRDGKAKIPPKQERQHESPRDNFGD